MTIAEYLRQQQNYIQQPCGGKGICGKCKVRVRHAGTSEEGTWVLACQTEMEADMELLEPALDTSHIATFTSQNNSKQEGMLAVDLGSTTIAVKNLENGEVALGENHQRTFGQDVISRIQAGIEGHGPEMYDLVWKDLRKLMEQVHFQGRHLMVSGNTTMEHLLQGWDVSGLAQAPFHPYELSDWEGEREGFHVKMMPGCSGFVGGDVVSGIYALDLDQTEGMSLLLDLGTNGEMVLGNQDGFWVTSTAAGPALEGGCISQGMASLEGAICDVSITRGFSRVTTIGDAPAVGICGSGVIAATAALLQDGILDCHGTLKEPYDQEGFPLYRRTVWEEVRFTQEDVRQVQLAKGAIRAGMELLLREAGISYDQVSKVYLAGGFGQGLDVSKATVIGLLPKAWEHKVIAVGNTSLKGAEKWLRSMQQGDVGDTQRIQKIPALAREVVLANHEDFSSRYISYMEF